MNPWDMTTRRAFLHRGLTLVGAAATVPCFLEQSALAVSPQEGARTRSRPGVPEDRVLVVVQLAGGNDGLNTLVPIRNDLYYKYRPQLAVKADATLRIDSDEHALHPAMGGFKSLYDDGMLGIVQGVGYPNPNRSHFKSTDIWSTASPDGRVYTGWLGRYFDNTCKGQETPDPESGLALTTEVPLAMRGQKFTPVAFQRPESLTWAGGRQRGKRDPAAEVATEAFGRLNQPARGRTNLPELSYLQRTAMDARLSAEQIQKAAAGKPEVSYPNSSLAVSLRTVARLVSADMPTRIYYVSQGGYDTHAGQTNRHPQLLTQLGDALKAFVQDLMATGQLDRVTIMTFSEFGRRVRENASAGTDHGAAAPMFVIGKRVRPGLHGEFPGLDNLDGGDLAFTTDFRSVYSAILKDWLGANSAAIVGQEFAPVPIFERM